MAIARSSPGTPAADLDTADTSAILDAAHRAAARFSWYAALLEQAGFNRDPSLARVPVLREADLATTYYAAEAPPEPGTATFVTSGTSTGVRKRVDWTRPDHERYVDQRADLVGRFLGGSCASACADLGTGHAAASALEVFGRIGLPASQIDVTWPLERHVEILRAERPDALFTMPMILERIAAAGGPGYMPRRVLVVGDLAPLEWRAAMCHHLGIDAAQMMDVFGSIEVGAIAYSDSDAGAYLFHDHIVPELIASPRPGYPDAGLLLLTSTERDGFPAIRYAAGDIVSGLRQFDVRGRRTWGYDRHLGREGNELKHGEMLSLHAIAIALAGIVPSVAWDVRRAGMEVVIEIESASYSAETAAQIRAAVRADHPDVDQMIRSGLVGDIGVEPRSFATAGTKRLIADR